MSSKQNDNNNMIHLGNYEEFFILYTDNELNAEQMRMVDDFLLSHPDLKAELEIFQSMKLPLETISFDKEALMAESMKMMTMEEELFLFIDNELPGAKRRSIEAEIASNKEFQSQYHSLLKTKLDASEKIICPDKEALYHRAERVVYFKPWMRVAAAVLIIGGLAGLYFMNSRTERIDMPVAVHHKKERKEVLPVPNIVVPPQKDLAELNHAEKTKHPVLNKLRQNQLPDQNKNKQNDPVVHHDLNDMVAYNTTQHEELPVRTTSVIDANAIDTRSASVDVEHFSKQNISGSPVTSSLHERITNSNRTLFPGAEEPTVAKGSVKNFLRKASRLIEKRTGFDPVNDDGKLLIGVVAINLNK